MKVGAVDLFCGVGGLTYGMQKAGIEVIAGIDLDSSCKFAYEINNKAKFINKNITEVTGQDIESLLDGFDVKVLVGCAPCQPFSSHRKNKKNRKSHKDWSLLYEFARIIEECKPDVISMENVPSLIREQVFDDFVATLHRLGYHTTYDVVDAADYGVAQRRRRLVLLSSTTKKIELLPPTHKNCKNFIENVIASLPPVNAGEKAKSDALHRTAALSDLNIKRIRASIPGGTWRDWPEELLLECHKKQSGESYSSVYGRMEWNDVSPTITTQFICYGTGRFGHPKQDRALTLREGALLQSFPPDYIFTENNESFLLRTIAKHIGNAVPPRLGEIIGESIVNSFS